jgi:hypothetical protein
MPRALLEVVQLSRQIARRAAGDAGRGAVRSRQLFAMTLRAVETRSKAPAFRHRAKRHIDDETGMGIAQLLTVHIHRRLDQPGADGLACVVLVRQPQSFLAAHPGDGRGFHHLDRHRRRQGSIIGRGLGHLSRRHRLGEAHHLKGIGLARLRTFAGAVFHVAQLAGEIVGVKARDIGVLRPPLAIGIMTGRAGGDATALIAGGDQRRHRGVIARIPVGGWGVVRAADLAAGEVPARARQGEKRAVIPGRARLILRCGHGIGPIWIGRGRIGSGRFCLAGCACQKQQENQLFHGDSSPTPR